LRWHPGGSENGMRFALSAEQDQFRQATRDFLTTYSSPARVREVIDTDDVVDEKLWRRLANDLGVVGLNIPEEFGGTGATFVEVAIAAEELGRALACVPFLSTAVLATSALLESGDPVACRDILPAIAEGRSILTVALGDAPARTDRPADPVPAAESVDGQWRVNGELTFVLDGAGPFGSLVHARVPPHSSAQGRSAVSAVGRGAAQKARRGEQHGRS